MTVCPYCGFQNPEGVHICLTCASMIQQKCPKCGSIVPSNGRFCGECGSPVETHDTPSHNDTETQEPDLNMQERMMRNLRKKMPSTMVNQFLQSSHELYGQRREVTILDIEISELEKISNEIDSEDLYLAIDNIIQPLAEIVYKYEGTIDKSSGTGMTVLFGLPVNHENDPERAVRAALEMQSCMSQLLDELNDRYHYDFLIQVGINTGTVIAGKVDEQQHLDYTIVGNTVRLASQLQSHARPGQVLVSFSTYQRSRPIIDYQSQPSIQLNGEADPIKTFQPLGVRHSPGQVRGLPGLQVPMIGRREQLDQLISVYRQVIETRSSEIVLCSGEAGIGKSRLVAEFSNYLAAQPVKVVRGTCALYMRITPYRILADVLRNMLGISELDPTARQRKTLQKRLEQLDLDRSDILPYMMHVLGILHTNPVLEVRIQLLEPSMLRRQTHFALRMFFIAESKQNPLVLIFDDLHWVDQSSGQFLEYFSQSLDASPILLMMVARDFEKSAFASAIKASVQSCFNKPQEVNIQPLTEDDAHLLVDELVHEDTKLAKEMKALITSRAGGNPYYTEELVRTLIDHGGLINWDGEWHLTVSAVDLIREVPGTLSDIILARFDHLQDPLKVIIMRASVLGVSFSFRLLEALIPKDISNLTAALNELEERDFLIHTRFDSEDGYIFKHPLVQETIYKTLLKRDSKNLHSQVAEIIETGSFWLPSEKNHVLAYHLAESIKPERAIPYLLISAEKASQHFANDTVIQLYRQALSLMDTVENPSLYQREKAQVGLAQALKFTGELEDAASLLVEIVERIPKSIEGLKRVYSSSLQIQLEALRELADLRAREGELDFAVQLLKRGMELLSDSGRKAYPIIWRRLADRLAWVYFRQRNLDEAYNLVDLALLDTAAWESEDPITMASLYNTMGGIYWTRSRFADAIESVEHSLEIYKNLQYHWGVAISLANLGILHHSTEKWQQAVEYFEQADRLRREYGDDPERPTNLNNLGTVLIDLGENERARQNYNTSKEVSQRLGLSMYQVDAELGLCELSVIENNPKEARQHLENAGKLVESLDEPTERVANYFNMQSQVELLEGEIQKAKVTSEHALDISIRGSLQTMQVDALRILGSIQNRLDDFELAEKRLYESIELAQQLSDRFNEAESRYELGLLHIHWAEKNPLQQRQHIEQAVRSLESAIGVFETLGARNYLQLAKQARMQVPAPEKEHSVISQKSEVENQMNRLRAQLHLPDGEWYQSVIVSIVLRPRPGADEELIFETIAFLIPSLVEIIQENTCQVLHHKDGITIIYGAPAAREDDLNIALDTVIQLLNFYNELDQQTELSISIHIGIDVGKIVAGKVDVGLNPEFRAAGEPIQQARTLADYCPSSRVWVTQPVSNRTAYRFKYSMVQPKLFESRFADVVFQLEGLREQILPVRGFIGLKTPFVGRDHELEEMNKFSQVIKNGTGGIIWIEGEAGIGKSRLMREFSKHLGHLNSLIIGGVCTARHSEYAFSLFSDLLMKVFDIQHHFTPQQINQCLDQKLSLWSPELIETRPFMQLLLGVQPTGAQGERITSMEPEQLRRQTFVAIHNLFSALSARQPLVLILDDLQWIDSISADLMLYLSHLVVSSPVLFVCAQRQNEISPFEQVLARTRSMHPDRYIHLSINPLTIVQCRQLLNEFLANADLPDSFLSLIIQQSGGNPYFIEEFVRLLVEKDLLRLVRGKLVSNRILNEDALTVPASLESLIRARIDSLAVSARQLLQVASVIGHRFNQSLLAEVAEREDINKILLQLNTRGMLTQTAEDGYWEFSHPLIEVIVYNSVLKAQRRLLHKRTAEALENQWRSHEEEHAEDLAYHFRKAEVYDRALHYLVIAGERAATRHANEVAVSFFEQAAELVSAVPHVGDEARWRIIHQMGDVYQFIGNYDTSLAVLQSGMDLVHSSLLTPAQRASIFRRMADTAHKKGDQEQAIQYIHEALNIIGEPYDVHSRAECSLIHARLGWCYFMQSNLEAAQQAVMKCMEFAGVDRNLTTLAMAENYLGGILFRQGDLQQAMQHTRTAMNYWQQIGYSWGVAAALSNLGILESVSGNWQAAYNSIKRSLDLRQKMGDVDGVAITNHNLGNLVHGLGDVARAEQYYRDSLAVSRPLQMSFHVANSFVGLAQSQLYQGKVAEALESLKESLRLAQEINAPDVIAEAFCVQAEVEMAQNKLENAFQSAQTAAGLASQIGATTLAAIAWRLTSASLLRQGNCTEARAALNKAWQALEDGSDKIENGRLHAHEILLSLADNDLKSAREHRAAAVQVFKELGAARDLVLLPLIEDPAE